MNPTDTEIGPAIGPTTDKSGPDKVVASGKPLTTDGASLIDAYWRAGNYLSVGQIYLMDRWLEPDPLPPRRSEA